MISKKVLKVENFEIQVTKKSGQKNLYIRINPPNGDVTVSAPARTSDKSIKNFVLRKMPDITKIQTRMKNQYRQTKREYISGETCYYWGKPNMLQVIYEGRHSKIKKVPNKIIMTVPEGTSAEKREKLLTEWYRAELKKMLPILLAKCEKRVGVKINGSGRQVLTNIFRLIIY